MQDWKDWKNLVVAALTVVFMALYVLALFGLLRPAADDKLLSQFSPIISVIIGYFFGRAPSEKIEQNLQTQLNASREAAERGVKLEQKISDVKKALGAAAPAVESHELPTTLSGGGAQPNDIRGAVVAALKVLEG